MASPVWNTMKQGPFTGQYIAGHHHHHHHHPRHHSKTAPTLLQLQAIRCRHSSPDSPTLYVFAITINMFIIVSISNFVSKEKTYIMDRDNGEQQDEYDAERLPTSTGLRRESKALIKTFRSY
ncbi:hypothetical protein OIU85_028678 [Salix viminalis]|uniref:Transmembrane protein n=1 Tax=Salix viminalis TaxID=40686 RepID=A0A9Q0TBW0_SALVM|nr:hypothetical protein OIU85_028678 [Salix viminalis]